MSANTMKRPGMPIPEGKLRAAQRVIAKDTAREDLLRLRRLPLEAQSTFRALQDVVPVGAWRTGHGVTWDGVFAVAVAFAHEISDRNAAEELADARAIMEELSRYPGFVPARDRHFHAVDQRMASVYNAFVSYVGTLEQLLPKPEKAL